MGGGEQGASGMRGGQILWGAAPLSILLVATVLKKTITNIKVKGPPHIDMPV